jgi:hypothetical protein
MAALRFLGGNVGAASGSEATKAFATGPNIWATGSSSTAAGLTHDMGTGTVEDARAYIESFVDMIQAHVPPPSETFSRDFPKDLNPESNFMM